MTDVTRATAGNRGVTRQEAEKLCTELRSLGDQIRLRLHLGGADARDAWHELEPKLLHFEQRLARATEDAASGLWNAGKELKTDLERFRAELHMLGS